jgi:hypothetical protein
MVVDAIGSLFNITNIIHMGTSVSQRLNITTLWNSSKIQRKIDTLNTHIHDRSVSWLCANTSIKTNDRIKLVWWVQTSLFSDMMRACKCFPHVSKLPPVDKARSNAFYILWQYCKFIYQLEIFRKLVFFYNRSILVVLTYTTPASVRSHDVIMRTQAVFIQM